MASKMAGVSLGVVVLLTLFSLGCSDGKNQQLTYDNWHLMLEGEWMVKFFAPWCPACQHVAPVWRKLALKADALGFNVGEVDTTKEPALSGRFMIFSLPTIYHVKDGTFRKYEGPRSLQGFIDFISEQKWRETEPVPWWKSPNSFLMAMLGVLFKLSLLLKDFHELLTVTHGLPVWASYALFGISTVLAGLLIGMIIVVVSDYILGGPSVIQAPQVPVQPSEKESEEEPGEEHSEQCDKEEKEEAKDNDDEKSSVRKRVTATTD